jgi:hypothetical protein
MLGLAEEQRDPLARPTARAENTTYRVPLDRTNPSGPTRIRLGSIRIGTRRTSKTYRRPPKKSIADASGGASVLGPHARQRASCRRRPQRADDERAWQ